MPRWILGLVAALVLAPTVAASAAQNGEPATVAPAIGPWLGAPRGSITAVDAVEGGIVVSADAVDADSAGPIGYRITVDGRPAVVGESPDPRAFGEAVRFEAEVEASSGTHAVCLQLDDRRLGRRTVDCVDAMTAPRDTVSPAVAAAATGALVTTTGVVVPVTGGTAGAWQVTTPCGHDATISEGTFVPRARVVVDPGHGGSESGAAGIGILEKSLNLEVARHVVAEFEELGIDAQLTRTADYRLPIKTRADIATALAPDVFISVHHNGGATRRSSRPGTEVFYAAGLPESQRLAAILYEDLVASLSDFDVAWVSSVSEGASLRRRDDGQDLYGIHRYSPEVTSVITEYLYLSNSSEAYLMRRDGMAEHEARAIVDGILRWWSSDDLGTTRGRDFTDSSSSGTGGFDGCIDPVLTVPPINAADLASDRAGSAEDGAVVGSGTSLLPALFLGRDPALG